MRAAASSIASGKPSSLRQTAARVSALLSSSRKTGRTARARSTKRQIASFCSSSSREGPDTGGSGRGSTGNTCSPRRWSGARLVARICNAGEERRSRPARSATSARTCSQLSSKRRVCRRCRYRIIVSEYVSPGSGTRLNAAATIAGARAGSTRDWRSTQTTPSTK